MLICFLDFYVCVIDVPDCDYFTFQKCFLSKMFVCVCPLVSSRVKCIICNT